MFRLRELSGGPTLTIFSLVKDGECECEKFLANLQQEDPEIFERLTKTLDDIAENGIPENREIYRPLRNDLFEIVVWRVRIVVFVHEGNLICTHGFLKSSQRAPDAEIKLGAYLRSEFRVAAQRDAIEEEEI